MLVMKMMIQLTQTGREVAGALFDTWLVMETDPILTAMIIQGRRYAAAVRSPGHGLSAPHLYVFGSLLDAIAKETKDELDIKMNQQYKDMAVEERAQIIRLCKVAKVFRSDQRKVAVVFGTGHEAQGYKQRILSLLKPKAAWTYKVGRAPAGHMERQLAAFLTDMIE